MNGSTYSIANPMDDEAHGSADAFIRCLERLEALIDRETAALRACVSIDLDEMNQKKVHLLLEFMRLSRALPQRASESTRRHLARLNAKLAENAKLLDLHLNAMSEIAKIMVASIQSEESDGTYSRMPTRICER